MTVRARFVDASGFSFFDEISDSVRFIYERYVAHERCGYDPMMFEVGSLEVDHLRVIVEIYRRETWFVPIGPLACPVSDEIGNRFEHVFRFEGFRR